jgi:hypothetical protein
MLALVFLTHPKENLISAAAQKIDQITLPMADLDGDLFRGPETWARRAFPT